MVQSRVSKDLVVPGEFYVALSGASFLREESVSGREAAPRDKFGLWDLIRRDHQVLFALTSIEEYFWPGENGSFLLFKALCGEQVLYVIADYSDSHANSYEIVTELATLKEFFEADGSHGQL